MKRTGIKATDDELASLKAAASAPAIMVGGVTPQDPAKLAHEIALKHGLPEIPGFYGCDLATGEFLTADNAPIPEGLADKVQPSERELAERVLGKDTVDSRALDRLFELWPEARVEVEHARGPEFGPGVRATIVSIRPEWNAGSTLAVEGVARCSRWDQFDRKRGRRLAFNRALKKVPRS